MTTRALFNSTFRNCAQVTWPDFNDLNSAKVVGSIPGPKTYWFDWFGLIGTDFGYYFDFHLEAFSYLLATLTNRQCVLSLFLQPLPAVPPCPPF